MTDQSNAARIAHTAPTRRIKDTACAFLLAAILLASLGGCGGSSGSSGGGSSTTSNPAQVRNFIAKQVGGLSNLTVPATDAEIPIAQPTDGNTAYRYEYSEAKRYLGKQLFHDPVRTNRIDTTYGAQTNTAQTGSCGSCHLGEVAGKAGQQLNFNVGGEGRGYTDAQSNFFARRRPRTDIFPALRSTQLFPGDALVDNLPTLTDIYLLPPCTPGTRTVTTPARGHKLPAPCSLVETGRLDGLDSVGRQSPSMIGFAFNTRLLLGGFAGEPNSEPGGLNPNNDPAQENLTLLLLDAHRMFTDIPPTPGEMQPGGIVTNGQAPVLQKNPAFVQLFRNAFPNEAAASDAAHDISLLVNDDTVLRATATYLRTALTRNTPFDHFIAGDNKALTAGQLRGARLFFDTGKHGAGCVNCHSGPMLNHQINDPDVAGIGQFVDENFINVGIGDHPLQALNRAARNDPNFHDFGRQEISGDSNDAFKFRSLTLRQLKEAVTFFHSGSPQFTSVKDVVKYFNAGVPQDPVAGAAPTLDTRFTNPHGSGSTGLGLSDAQVNDLTDFVENGLYDPAFSHYDASSTTRLFDLDPTEVAYSTNYPQLAALGAKDGFVLSGLAMDDNDPLTRRDEGLEFLDVTNKLDAALQSSGGGQNQTDVYKLTNKSTPVVTAPGVIDSASVIDTNLLILVKGLGSGIKLTNASGTTSQGIPYVRVYLQNGVLQAGQSITQSLQFAGAPGTSYQLDFLSGQGNP